MSQGPRVIKRINNWLKPHRTIPITPWRATNTWNLAPLRVLILAIGLFIFGLGEALLVQSNLGNSPWVVFAQGLSTKLPLSIGWSTFAISCAVLLLWIPLAQKPGFGTISNIVLIAFALQLGVDHIPEQKNFWAGLVYALTGIALVGIASSLYITTGLGAGPRDGLMTGIHYKTQVRVGRVRLGIEALVLMVGAALGGQVGVGTALFALLVGQAVAISFGVMARLTHK
ncbi:MAG: hypothetical protein F2787_02070 [Actinobacteria bacterium]|uniref:Unannotated protein n=1 Tax=freshwater metagenome TaxID=449393 RepID=A0A6J6MBC0_9ZZZZ|nr:hypothetical protein [Actinomycetota bacterium]MSX24539.1 hypothetical protein [Actinomycetota bacterium]MSY46836.1 hypothetical protein [Actinomycetota bacterium]MTB00223.1 hypothetical protein [Actinomycetota bacterium]